MYNQITGKEDLKNAIENKYYEQNEISEKIREILNKSLSSQDESVLSELQENYDKQQTQEGLMDFEKPQKIKDEILAKISEVSFFKSEEENNAEKAEEDFLC